MMDKVKEHNRLDKMIARTKELQKEIDHRHEVEEKVFELFSEGKFEEGDALLATLDDDKAREFMEEERQEAFSHKNVEITKRYIGVKKTEDYADVISNDEVKAIEKAVQEEPAPLETPNYFVIPDNDSQTITIMPDIREAVLKLDKTNALILASIIHEQVVGF